MVAENGALGLPEPFRVREFEGSVDEWLQRCRWQFEAIVDGHIEVDGKPVVACADHEQLFWHVVTTDKGPKRGRWLDLKRCEIVGRVWDLLERWAAGDPRACSWHERTHGRKNVAVAPVDMSFVVILRECREELLLVTTHPMGRTSGAARMAKVAATA